MGRREPLSRDLLGPLPGIIYDLWGAHHLLFSFFRVEPKPGGHPEEGIQS